MRCQMVPDDELLLTKKTLYYVNSEYIFYLLSFLMNKIIFEYKMM